MTLWHALLESEQPPMFVVQRATHIFPIPDHPGVTVIVTTGVSVVVMYRGAQVLSPEPDGTIVPLPEAEALMVGMLIPPDMDVPHGGAE